MFRRFFSKTIREAIAMRKHVVRLLHAQRDLMKPEALAAINLKMAELDEAIASKANTGKIRIKTQELQFAAEKWIKSYPNPVWRENVEVLLVAIAVAMGIRTFFLQPFKIPTGSMQPTLYGVTSVPDFSDSVQVVDGFVKNLDRDLPDDRRNKFDSDLKSEINGHLQSQQSLLIPKTVLSEMRDDIRETLESNATNLLEVQKNLIIPTGWQRVKEWFEGVSYLHVVAPADGTVEFGPMHRLLIFNLSQTISIGGVTKTLWFPPDYGESDLGHRAGIFPGRVYRKGEDVVKIKVNAGDHLFVDRLTYNFRRPDRGDIVVFETQGIPAERRESLRPPIPPDEFYIKRLCGLGGETISLAQDYELIGGPHLFDLGNSTSIGHLVVNGKPVTASTPHFENLYSFAGVRAGQTKLQFHDGNYYGHSMIGMLSSGQTVQIPANHAFVMGDNTMNSSDSRFWGDFPESSIIGKSFFVYWPITKRFGWGNQ